MTVSSVPRDGGGLVVEHVTKTYDSTKTIALADVSLSVASGQFVTIIGPSGCGKSTLLRILAGLEQADAGSVSIFGESVDRARENKHIGYVPQSLALLPWRNVLGNVQLPLQLGKRATSRTTDRDPVEILQSFGLGDVLDRLPAELSGGMRQRVAIARAFAFSPAILLMDEPFSALDEITGEMLRHQLLEFWENNQTTVVFVTHSVSEAVLLSDVVVVLGRAPGQVRAVIPVDLPRPRSDFVELTDEFHELERALRMALRSGMAERSE